jgi:hypothetical protein
MRSMQSVSEMSDLLPRWLPIAGAVAGSVVLAECGGGPAAPPPPNPGPGVTIEGRVSNVFDDAPVNSTLTVSGLPGGPVTTTTDAAGRFSISASAGTFPVAVTAGGYVERRTSVSSTSGPAFLSLIPASFDLVTFDQFARGMPGNAVPGVVRWVERPRLMLYEQVLADCTGGFGTIAGPALDAHVLTDAIETLRHALAALTGGLFDDFAEVVRYVGQVGEIVVFRELHGTGTIHAAECLSVANGQDGQADLLRDLPSGGYRAIMGVALWTHSTTGGRRRLVQMHEFGHALGLWHTFTPVPSIMSFHSAGYSEEITVFDRQAGHVMYRRPPGNRSPDVDPDGFSVNLTSLLRPPTVGVQPSADAVCTGPPPRPGR